jgi:2,4-dienoyl-CoA reductase-like NADH-dependent reductase (Old Yellow Enzyme family)
MLEEPITLNSLSLKNRIVKASMVENMATEQGEVTDRLIKLYKRFAAGGVGLLITGGAYVQRNGRSVKYLIGAHDDGLIPGLQRLTKEVHALDGSIILQVYHCGRQTLPELVGNDIIGPSPVRDTLTGIIPRPMAEEEIEATITAFGQSAGRALEANFDGVEVMAGHGYLINQFLSKRTNQRRDQWGGPLENRSSFLFRIIERIRETVGPNFPLLVKLNTEDRLKGGFTVEESAWVAEKLGDLGVDAIKFTGGTFESALNISRGDIPADEILEMFHGWEKFRIKLIIRAMKRKFSFKEAYFLDNVKKIKPRVHIPIILVGGLRSPALMEDILKKNYADMIALGRPLIREPDLPNKILKGLSTLPQCINCNRCFIRISQAKSLRCYAK